jgi:hypothetical protein
MDAFGGNELIFELRQESRPTVDGWTLQCIREKPGECVAGDCNSLQPNPIRYSLERLLLDYAGMIINSTPDIQLRDSALPFPPDREGVILRLGMVLRRMNELARKEIGPRLYPAIPGRL